MSKVGLLVAIKRIRVEEEMKRQLMTEIAGRPAPPFDRLPPCWPNVSIPKTTVFWILVFSRVIPVRAAMNDVLLCPHFRRAVLCCDLYLGYMI